MTPEVHGAKLQEMLMFTAIIADDEKASARLLRETLEASGKVRILAVAENGLECLEYLEEHEPDVLFLDVQMGEPSGIDVAETVLESDSPPLIVFVTGHENYAVKAFELAALDYVVKPIDLSEFEARIAETIARIEGTIKSQQYPDLADVRQALAQIANQQQQPVSRKLPIKDYDEGTVRLLDPAAVIYAQRKDRRVYIRTAEHSYPTYFTIEKLAQKLASGGFFRASASAIINLEHVEHMIPNGDGSYDVLLQAGAERVTVAVSRSRARELFDLLDAS